MKKIIFILFLILVIFHYQNKNTLYTYTTEFDFKIKPKEKQSNKIKKVIVINNIPVFSQARMSASRIKLNLKSGKIIHVNSNIIKTKSKRSFDFAVWFHKNKKYYLPVQFLGTPPVKQIYENDNIVIGKEKVDKYQALPLNYQPNDLTLVPKRYRATGYKSRKMKLRKEALKAFIKMCDAAKKEGIELKLLSCFRSAQYQQGPYKRAIKAAGPKQMSSAKPGHSEHQLGTVADVTCSDVNYRLTQDFAGTKTHKWIKDNASQFGIYISYDKKNYFRKGYIWEPWHLRYWGNKTPSIN